MPLKIRSTIKPLKVRSSKSILKVTTKLSVIHYTFVCWFENKSDYLAREHYDTRKDGRPYSTDVFSLPPAHSLKITGFAVGLQYAVKKYG